MESYTITKYTLRQFNNDVIDVSVHLHGLCNTCYRNTVAIIPFWHASSSSSTIIVYHYIILLWYVLETHHIIFPLRCDICKIVPAQLRACITSRFYVSLTTCTYTCADKNLLLHIMTCSIIFLLLCACRMVSCTQQEKRFMFVKVVSGGKQPSTRSVRVVIATRQTTPNFIRCYILRMRTLVNAAYIVSMNFVINNVYVYYSCWVQACT